MPSVRAPDDNPGATRQPGSSVPDQGQRQTVLLKFQLGPVQDFIAAARSTRDLWSGSYLISWMMAQAIAWLRRDPDCGRAAEFVFPFIPADRSHAAFPATLRRIEEAYERKENSEWTGDQVRLALMPAIPNILLVRVPASCTPKTVERMIENVFSMRDGSKWRLITDACLQFFADHGIPLPDDAKSSWQHQLANHWQTSWQLIPWEGDETEALKAFRRTPVGGKLLTDFPKSPPALWMANYHVLSHRLDARRQTRNFSAWIHPAPPASPQPPADMDSFTGRAEAIIGKKWLKSLHLDPKSSEKQKQKAVQNLFRSSDALGAVSIVKRVWHKAYLNTEEGFRKENLRAGDTWFNIPSTLGIAAFPWVKRLREKLRTEKTKEEEKAAGFAPEQRARVQASFEAFKACIRAMDGFGEMDFAKAEGGELDDDWLQRVDWQVFQTTAWESQIREAHVFDDKKAADLATAGLEALRKLIQAADMGSADRYWAVVAMDGDGMGKWLSGSCFSEGLTLKWHQAISAGLYFATLGGSIHIVAPLDAADTGISNTRTAAAAKGAFGSFQNPWDPGSRRQGKVIYAGADDVLAIVPASQAMDCARDMADAFAEAMHGEIPAVFRSADFTISAGIAIGHIKEPLQDMVETAWAELKRAKRQLNGNAMAVTLFKRSGEMIRWGAGMKSAAFELRKCYRDGRTAEGEPVSSRFPHKLAELLRPYQTYTTDRDTGLPDYSRPEPLTPELKDIAVAEFTHVVRQQAAGLPEEAAGDFRRLASAFLEELVLHNKEAADSRKRPLSDFTDLFLLEAFITRSGD